MQPVQPCNFPDTPIAYVDYFVPVTTARHAASHIPIVEPALKMYCFKRHLRSNKTVKGGIIPLSNIWYIVQLIPNLMD